MEREWLFFTVYYRSPRFTYLIREIYLNKGKGGQRWLIPTKSFKEWKRNTY